MRRGPPAGRGPPRRRAPPQRGRRQGDGAARQAREAQLEELARAAGNLERRLVELQDAPEALARAELEAQQIDDRLQAAARPVEGERTGWVRDRQYADTKRTE